MVKVTDEFLLNYLQYKFNRLDSNFTEEELSSIRKLTFNTINYDGSIRTIDFSVLKYFKGLEEIEFICCSVSTEILYVLNSFEKLYSVTFNKCTLESMPVLKKVKRLEFNETQLYNYDFLENVENIESLSLVGVDVNNINFVNKLNHLNILRLSNSNIFFKFDLSKTNITTLYLDGTNIYNFKYIVLPTYLKTLIISNYQYVQEQNKIKFLEATGVEILHDDFESSIF